MIVDGMIWILVVEEAKYSYNTEEAKNNVKLIFLCVGGIRHQPAACAKHEKMRIYLLVLDQVDCYRTSLAYITVRTEY